MSEDMTGMQSQSPSFFGTDSSRPLLTWDILAFKQNEEAVFTGD